MKAKPVRDDILLVAAYLYQTRRNLDEKEAEDWAAEQARADPVKFVRNPNAAEKYLRQRVIYESQGASAPFLMKGEKEYG